jgi:uncharacterized protein YggL (DUF469 family)
MDWYSITVEFRGNDEQHVTAEGIDTFMSLVEPYDGVASGGPGYESYDATVGLTAPGASEATEQARALVRNAARQAQLPDWPIVRLEAVREDVLDEQHEQPQRPDLVSAPEIGALLGVNRQRVHQLAAAHPQFPAPLHRLGVGSLWDRRAITSFAQTWDRRPGRRAKLAG